MTRRILMCLFLTGAAATAASACDGSRWGYDYGYRYGSNLPFICSQYSSCGSCTPVVGCGWCAFDKGGACVSDPADCNATQFSFTWEPNGCATVGRIVEPDGGTSADGATPVKKDAGPADASPTAAREAGSIPADANAR